MLFSKESYMQSIAEHSDFGKIVYPNNLEIVNNFMTGPVEVYKYKTFTAKSARFEGLNLVEELIWQNRQNADFAYFMTIEYKDRNGPFYVLRASY